MYEGIRSPAVHVPKTMGDLALASTRFPQAVFWAGGTFIMSKPDYYPSRRYHDIISLHGLGELTRINRTDRYLEIGSMVTISQILSIGRQTLPKLLQKTLESMGTYIIQQQATIGGTLCTGDLRLALCGTLAALHAEAEIKTCLPGKTTTGWIEISKLYDRSGALLLKNNDLISRIRIAFEREDFPFFIIAGDPMATPGETVMVSFICSYSQSVINLWSICITLPLTAFYIPLELQMMTRGTMLPLSMQQIRRIIKSIMEELISSHPAMSEIQRERTRRAVEYSLYALNAQVLAEQ